MERSVSTPEYNPVKCYSIKELAEAMGTSIANVKNWISVGLISGIETGKSTVFPIPEIQRFQAEMLGNNISNLYQATLVANHADRA